MKPDRMREVMQRKHGCYAVFQEAIDHPAVLIKRVAVELSWFGLDSCPFNGKSITVDSEVLEQPKIILPALPVITSIADQRVEVPPAKPARGLPTQHIVVDPTFNLVGGCCYAP